MTALGLREHPDAREEFLDALDWYDDHANGLGRRLLTEFNANLTLIRTWPEAAPRYRGRVNHPGLRAKSLRSFPYRIISFVRDAEVVVVAYAHAKRRPGYWRKRLDGLRSAA